MGRRHRLRGSRGGEGAGAGISDVIAPSPVMSRGRRLVGATNGWRPGRSSLPIKASTLVLTLQFRRCLSEVYRFIGSEHAVKFSA